VDELVPLTEEDRKLLTDDRRAFLKVAEGMGIIAILVLIPLVVLHTLGWLIVFSSVSLLLAAFAIMTFNFQRPAAKDLRLGQKQRVSGTVEAQDVEVTRTKDEDGLENDATYRWWIQIAGKKITVTEDQYYQFKKGDTVEAFVGPNSGKLFGITKEYMRRPFG